MESQMCWHCQLQKKRQLFLLPKFINLFVCWGNMLSNSIFVCVIAPSSEFCPHSDKELQQIRLNCFSLSSLLIRSLAIKLLGNFSTYCMLLYFHQHFSIFIFVLFFFLRLFWSIFETNSVLPHLSVLHYLVKEQIPSAWRCFAKSWASPSFKEISILNFVSFLFQKEISKLL